MNNPIEFESRSDEPPCAGHEHGGAPAQPIRTKRSMKAAIYGRAQRDSHSAHSVEDQIEACLEYAATNGYEVVDFYVDDDAEGGTGKVEFQRVLRDGKARRFNVLLCDIADHGAFEENVLHRLIRKLGRFGIMVHDCATGELGNVKLAYDWFVARMLEIQKSASGAPPAH